MGYEFISDAASDDTKLPLAGGTMTGNITMGDNQIIIDSTVADGTVSGIVTTGNAGSNMVIGDVIVLNTDNAWDPANADSAAAAHLGTGMLGISLSLITGGPGLLTFSYRDSLWSLVCLSFPQQVRRCISTIQQGICHKLPRLPQAI